VCAAVGDVMKMILFLSALLQKKTNESIHEMRLMREIA